MKTKDVLKGLRVYLSGPIENTKDDGVDWRKKFADLDKKKALQLNIIDPTDKKDDVIAEISKERDRMRQLKSDHEFEELTSIMKRVRRWDLRACDYCHFLVVYINAKIPTWGTIDECVTVERQQKPIFAIVEGGPAKAPDWAFPIVNYKEMFYSVEDLIGHLVLINEGKTSLDHRWVIINGG